jgi:hypothetical protein
METVTIDGIKYVARHGKPLIFSQLCDAQQYVFNSGGNYFVRPLNGNYAIMLLKKK